MVLGFGLGSFAQSDVVKDYSKAVFLDENFRFDGEKLELPDLKKSFDKPSTCYEDEEPFDKSTKFYDCVRKSDSREYDVILSNHNGNSFDVSYINDRGIKNYFSEVKTKTITTQVKNGDIQNQFICDFNTMPEPFHQSVFDLKCHLITPKTCQLLNSMKQKENSNNPEAWSNFLNHLNSSEYKKAFQDKAKLAYNDIFTSINKNIMKKDFDKYNKYTSSISHSTYDLIKEREKTLSSPIKTFNDFKQVKDLMKIIATNMISKCAQIIELWDTPSVRDQAQNTKTSTTVGR